MVTYDKKLLVIRGNSGSGKSALAQKLRDKLGSKTALVGQDNLRRLILKEKEVDGGDNIELIRQVVEFALARDYNVILEGILYAPRYRYMLKQLTRRCPEYYFYYLDVSFEETLKRHATKPNAGEFGKKEMKEWYKPLELTKFENEKVIPETFSLEQSANMIMQDLGLL